MCFNTDTFLSLVEHTILHVGLILLLVIALCKVIMRELEKEPRAPPPPLPAQTRREKELEESTYKERCREDQQRQEADR
jgi:hypothetical protein